MRTPLNVARYLLLKRSIYVVLPWAVLALVFAVCLAVGVGLHAAGTHVGHYDTGGIAAIFVFLFIAGLNSTTSLLPFALALGTTRRAYYLGSATLGVALAAIYGLALTILQAIERATGGWGVQMRFFRVPYILNGPWYVTWLTAFVCFTLLYCYGTWYGLIYRRWNLLGLLTFLAIQIVALTAAGLAASVSDGWHSIGHFFTTISAAGLTGALLILAAALLLGGLSTARRLTV